MGTKAIELVEKSGIKVEELLTMLNKAYADEWLAYYQYWIGARLAVGLHREAVESEMKEHAGEELEHAEKLADRIIQLGGTPIIDPKEWFNQTNCGYDAPVSGDVHALIEQNIKAEQCAISVYTKILDFVKGKDPVTYHVVYHILQDELEHEHDLQDIQEDLATAFKK